MIRSSKLIVLVSAVFMCVLPATTFAATYTVTKTADTADGTCDADCSLREAVISANTGGADTIVIPAGRYEFTRTTAGEDFAAQGDLDFTDVDTTTVTGAGADSTIIDPNDSDRAIDVVSNASVVISDLGTDDSFVDDTNGGAIRTAGNTTLTNVTIQNAVVSGNGGTVFLGGGVYCSAGLLTVTGATISSNMLTEDGSELGGGGIAIGADCSSAITQTTLDSNSAHHGGAVYYTTSASTTNTLTDSTLSNNTATDAGGGIVAYGLGSDNRVTLERVTINDNNASAGAGIFTQAPMDMTNATIFGNVATDAGGALGSNPGSETPLIRIAFSTLSHNQAVISGGIYADAGADVQMWGSILANNTNGVADYDCYGTLTSLDYNYIGTPLVCDVTAQDHDVFNVTPPSYMYTASLRDAGGYVETLYMWGEETLDIVPTADCLDAVGNALSEDARGMTRPQNSNCDRGAVEKDQTNPVVTVTPGTDTVACVTGSWTDAGATVTDNFSSGLTASTEDAVDVNTAGVQEIVYTSTADGDYNTGTATREVTVEDDVAPEVTLLGESAVSVQVNDTYTDAGATVSDLCDGSLAEVDTDNSVDTAVPGDYTVTYTAEDASGNTTTVTRTVTVVPDAPLKVHKADIHIRKNGTKRIVSWAAADYATFYKLRILSPNKAKKIFSANDLIQHRRVFTKKWRKHHLVSGTTYRIKVKACNVTGCSAWSKEKLWTIQ